MSGFSLLNQKISLEVDFGTLTLSGRTELTISPLSSSLREVRINARQMDVSHVLVNETRADFHHSDPLRNMLPDPKKDPFAYPELADTYLRAVQEGARGELSIRIPESIEITKITGLDGDAPTIVSAVKAEAENNEASCFTPLLITVFYTVREPRNSVYFVLPDPHSAPKRLPHMHVNNIAAGARSWFPCVDKPHVKCPWILEITIPRTVAKALDLTERACAQEMIAIASGDLVDHIVHPKDPFKKVFVYSLKTPVAAGSILLAVGPFECLDIPGWGVSSQTDALVPDSEETENQQLEGRLFGGGRTFYLPGRREQVQHSTGFLHHALSFLEQYMGSLPFSSYKQVFVDDAYGPSVTGATCAILSTNLLLDPDIIDNIFETRRLLCRALTSQWIDHYLGIRCWADTWLSVGLNNYITALFLQKHLGNNEYRYRLKMDILRVCRLDIGQAPLYPISPEVQDPPLDGKTLQFHEFHPESNYESARFHLMSLKSPIVLHMMERWLGKGLVQKTVNKFMVSAMSEELPVGMSTQHFLRVARKICGRVEIKSFSELWIYGAGCPRFSIKFHFNKKKMLAEFKFIQECTNSKSGAVFYGPLTIRLMEPSGIYDTQILIQDIQKKFIIPYHTKYKRIKKNTKKDRRIDVDGKDDKDDMDEDDDGDSGPDEKDGQERVIYEWIRVDPEIDWLCELTFEQPDHMAVSQLHKDKDVAAQYEALWVLSKDLSLISTSSLVACMKDSGVFYRVRAEAAFALASQGIHTSELTGLFELKRVYKDLFCRKMRDVGDEYFPVRNDFSVLQNYHIQKAVIAALSRIRDEKGQVPLEVKTILLEALVYNDNTSNEFSDIYWVSTIMTALSDTFLPEFDQAKVPEATQARALQNMEVEEFVFPGEREPIHNADIALLKETFEEFERFRSRDRLVPSYHNVITLTSLQCYLKWMVIGLIPVDLPLFLGLTRYGTFLDLRMLSIDAILILNGLKNPEICSFFLHLLVNDPDPRIRYHAGTSLARILALRPLNQDIARVRDPGNYWSFVDPPHLSSRVVGKVLWSLLTSPTIDHRLRSELLSVCESLYYLPPDIFHYQPPPKLKIKMIAPGVDAPQEDTLVFKWKPATDYLKLTDVKMVDVEPNALGDASEQTPIDIVTPISSGPRVDYERLNKAGAYIIKKLNEHESSEPFWDPVDEMQVPNYRSVIKRPMDLDTIGRNLRAGVYGERQAGLIVDVRQMFKNCYIFNMEESAIYQHAKRLEHYFERELLPEAVPEMAAVMGAPSAPIEPRAPIISVKIPTLTKSLAKKKEKEKECAKELQLLPTDWQACKKILTKLMQHPAAVWFLEPVDPIALGIPMYFDFIKRPMDLGTVSRRLEAYSYKTVVQFVDDVELVFRNSLSFNPFDSIVYQDTVTLAGVFDKTFVKPKIKEGKVPISREPLPFKAVPVDPAPVAKPTPAKPLSIKIAPLKISLVQKPAQGGRGADALISKVLKKVKAHKEAKIFLYPVDGSIYPDYYVKITQPIDLDGMTQKLERGGYQNTEEFVDDMQLMFKNCYTFNEPNTYGYTTGQNLEKFFKKEWDAATKKKK